mmetsp:Transcript_10676/g.17437  ORF Transcript_10676/g.17437 Transcript_10676/m.17437 type:complete len:168 (+) Transcript_10676:375-878(+)
MSITSGGRMEGSLPRLEENIVSPVHVAASTASFVEIEESAGCVNSLAFFCSWVATAHTCGQGIPEHCTLPQLQVIPSFPEACFTRCVSPGVCSDPTSQDVPTFGPSMSGNELITSSPSIAYWSMLVMILHSMDGENASGDARLLRSSPPLNIVYSCFFFPHPASCCR